MTICIAAACENKYIVVATDRMLTVNPPNIEVEGDYVKTVEITKNCVAATSGSALAFTPLLREVKAEIMRQSTTDIEQIVNLIRSAYFRVRNRKLEEEILFPMGLTLKDYYANQQGLAPSVVSLAVQNMMKYNYNLWILVAGVDEKGPHLTRLENPGKTFNYDTIGYLAIGSGEIHAVSTFIASGYGLKATLQRGLAVAFEAKKRSEKAPGVGELTDMYVVTKEGATHLPEEAIVELNGMYEKRLQSEEKVVSEVEAMVAKMGLEKYVGKEA